MSVFGKYGTGGSNPGKWPGGPNESTVEFSAARQGTEKGNPDSMPEVMPVEGSHK